jgi:hypothetical protein
MPWNAYTLHIFCDYHKNNTFSYQRSTTRFQCLAGEIKSNRLTDPNHSIPLQKISSKLITKITVAADQVATPEVTH